jgi:hypothetical protein
MKKQLTSVVDFWNKNRFSNKTLPQIPRGIFLSLLFLCVYFSLATQSIIPLTCKSVSSCGSSTKKGTILIRPFIAESGLHRCGMTGLPNFSPFVPITENLRLALEANNFDATKVFADFGSDDKTKWQIMINLRTACDEICDDDKEPTNLSMFIGNLSDYQIVRTNTSNVNGFAISLPNMPVSALATTDNPKIHRNYEGSMTIIEPCQTHASCDCDPTTKRVFRGLYEGGISRTDVNANDEIRLTLIGGQSPFNGSCEKCQ